MPQNLPNAMGGGIFQDYSGVGNQKLSSFDDTSKNLLVVSDNESGSIVLFHQEYYLSKKDQRLAMDDKHSHGKYVNKFIVNIYPRVLLVPSISDEVGPVIDHCLVRSPAQYILSSSSHFLVTLHSDNRIRLWNTNDGRCVMVSSKDMLVTKAHKIKKFKYHPGHIMVIGTQGDVCILNVYTMTILKHLMYEFQGFVQCFYKNKFFYLCDSTGKIFVWKDESEASPLKNLNSIENNSLLLELCNNDEQEIFSLSLENSIQCEQRNRPQQILTFYFGTLDLIIVVGQQRIDLIKNQETKTEYVFDNPVIFAKFLNKNERDILLCVDNKMNLLIFDAMKLKFESTNTALLDNLNLFDRCKYFDMSNSKTDTFNPMIRDSQEAKAAYVQDLKAFAISQLILDQTKPFKYCSSENLLYTFIQSKGTPRMISWTLEAILENLDYGKNPSDCQIPMFVNQVALFPKQPPNCLINFNPLIIRNYYNKHQYQFFFSDEVVTDTVTYTSFEHPCMIIGTNYGRIFMMPMFQEQEEKVYPIVLIDAHHQSPITQMFVAYNTSRKLKGQSISGSSSPFQQNIEGGGHLISVSEDGTLAITNLNSGDIHKQLIGFMVDDQNKKKADQFMLEKNKNQRERRRHSIHQTFTMNNFYQLVSTKPQKVFNYSTFGSIKKIIEVRSLSSLHSKHPQKQSHQKKYQTPERKTEEGEGKQRRSSSVQNLLSQDDSGRVFSATPYYACIGESGEVFVLHITNTQVAMHKYVYLDSDVIGAFQDEELQMFYFLTDKLSFYVYNSKSMVIERKTDFKYAIHILQIKETVDHLLHNVDLFRLKSKQDHDLFDFDTFSQIFKKKSLMMGVGSHKTLDYLSLSLNLPLKYQPSTLWQNKYSKALHDLLRTKSHMNEFQKKEESAKITLRAINEAFYLGNKLYKSDFSKEMFENHSGVTVLQTKECVCRSKQQMLIINSRKMIHVMRQKMFKVTSNYQGRRSSQRKMSRFNTHQQDDLMEEVKQPMSGGIRRSSTKRDSGFAVEIDSLSKVQWPTRLLSLIHPFNIDEQVDVMLEQFFGLNLPFLDFRIGIQGMDEAFSFVLSKEDEDFHSERSSTQKILKLLRLSKERKELVMTGRNSDSLGDNVKVGLQLFNEQNGQLMDNEPLGRFFNSEYWKISSYLSTIIPTFFLSIFVSVVEYAQNDVKFILQEWLFILQRINQQRTITDANEVSMSVISKIMLMKDHNISSTARDVIMKPILYTLDPNYLKTMMNEWQSIIIDTYKKLSRESNMKKAYGGGMQQQPVNQAHPGATHQRSNSGQTRSHPSNSGAPTLASSLQSRFNGILGQSQHPAQKPQDINQINPYFGDLEIRGLINLSYFTLYYSQHVDVNIQYRVSKITTILTREIVQKFNDDRKKYIHLLTILLQLLSTLVKTQSSNTKYKQIIDQVIKLLLILFNSYKAPLNKEQFITRITADNFHLIRPTHSDLYLKLTAAKALLEIGENFTHDFLQIIQDQATNLNEGYEYQSNVLEILRYFINGYGENLEHHLIQITQILLKCLDPNELALRKNSHKLISVILSIMVKIFPMVAFHHESQRLAVGTHDGPIAIYDVRTSAKWKILEGHTGNVTCLTFDSKGNLLASYSSVDLTIRLWKVGNTGFFSTIMGGTGKCSREIKLNPLHNAKNPHHLIQLQRQMTSSQFRNQNMMPESEPTKNQDGARINRCSIKFIQPKEKQVELIREDGSREIHNLVK